MQLDIKEIADKEKKTRAESYSALKNQIITNLRLHFNYFPKS